MGRGVSWRGCVWGWDLNFKIKITCWLLVIIFLYLFFLFFAEKHCRPVEQGGMAKITPLQDDTIDLT